MKCEGCGIELKEGQMYCSEKCKRKVQTRRYREKQVISGGTQLCPEPQSSAVEPLRDTPEAKNKPKDVYLSESDRIEVNKILGRTDVVKNVRLYKGSVSWLGGCIYDDEGIGQQVYEPLCKTKGCKYVAMELTGYCMKCERPL